MTRTYKLKNIPQEISEWFSRYKLKYPGTFIDHVYTYKSNNKKIYVPMVCKFDDEHYSKYGWHPGFDYSHQTTIENFSKFGITDNWEL